MAKDPKSVEATAARLEATRKALGMSALEFSRAAGISIAAYSNWENGRQRPGLTQAIRLTTVHGLTLDWIYLGDASGLPLRLTAKLFIGSGTKPP